MKAFWPKLHSTECHENIKNFSCQEHNKYANNIFVSSELCKAKIKFLDFAKIYLNYNLRTHKERLKDWQFLFAGNNDSMRRL